MLWVVVVLIWLLMGVFVVYFYYCEVGEVYFSFMGLLFWFMVVVCVVEIGFVIWILVG